MTVSPESLFLLASNLVLPGWLLLIVAPRWRVTRWVVGSGALPLVLAVIYAACIGWHYFSGAAQQGGFSSLPEVAALFQDPWALLAGWVHYLCFDLVVGAWVSRDAQRRGVPHLLLVPTLVLTFLLGPVGFLLYHLLRRFYPRATPAAPTLA
ncbi:ABA4-like family protein [Hymenobacter cellulosivorans]|uniref:ABA4-like family protein n=1 Tax=Hymenobacter cellulosivorans TaxID=2932249 RepID=A0ABY4F8L4_9BACT|nr:ABA4-like family protein [Hymenobacter cellulosivorans]UOQ52546.1 ABA4-like family protein [Hymenobacter cellulosivorans]